jgi:hypothetical protein
MTDRIVIALSERVIGCGSESPSLPVDCGTGHIGWCRRDACCQKRRAQNQKRRENCSHCLLTCRKMDWDSLSKSSGRFPHQHGLCQGNLLLLVENDTLNRDPGDKFALRSQTREDHQGLRQSFACRCIRHVIARCSTAAQRTSSKNNPSFPRSSQHPTPWMHSAHPRASRWNQGCIPYPAIPPLQQPELSVF